MSQTNGDAWLGVVWHRRGPSMGRALTGQPTDSRALLTAETVAAYLQRQRIARRAYLRDHYVVGREESMSR